MTSKKTLVIGASENPGRYSYLATGMLLDYGHPVEALGLKNGNLHGIPIQTGFPELEDVDTVTLYVGPQNQGPYADYLLRLHPKRVIFNPGTENPELESLLQSRGIETEEACTLVLLRSGQF